MPPSRKIDHAMGLVRIPNAISVASVARDIRGDTLSTIVTFKAVSSETVVQTQVTVGFVSFVPTTRSWARGQSTSLKDVQVPPPNEDVEETPSPSHRSVTSHPPRSASPKPNGRLAVLNEDDLLNASPSISSLALNRMLNIALRLTRTIAGFNHDEAARMWTLWQSQLQLGAVTTTEPPSPGATQAEPQQAVVLMGQDVYRDLLARDMGHFPDKLCIYEVLMDVVVHLGNDGAINQFKALFRGEVQYPRLSYLPFLLPRLRAFFESFQINPSAAAHEGWFSYEDVPLKWHYPLGLLYDLFSGAPPAQANGVDRDDHTISGETLLTLPWRLTVHFTDWPGDQLVQPDAEGKVLHDAFINSVKEADFLRNGTAKGIMSLSKDDSTQLWTAVQEHKRSSFDPIAQKLLYAQGAPLRHIPLKVYLPSSPSASEPSTGHLRVVQSLITPCLPGGREAQTLGMALHTLLPALFPSRKTPIHAKPVLHGAVVPLNSHVEGLLKEAAYLDGWLHLGLVMMG
ncbi:MAG: hypothetical protein Q9207_002394 [Kuettlingeria erythrocarpa]